MISTAQPPCALQQHPAKANDGELYRADMDKDMDMDLW